MSVAARTIVRLKTTPILVAFTVACGVVISGCGEAEPEAVVHPRTASSSSAALGDELDERDGGFSYRMPRGWKSVESKASRFLVAWGTDVDGYTPNITVSRERAPLRFDSYAERVKGSIGKLVDGAMLQQEAAFTTDSGLKGHRWIVLSDADGAKRWHAFYLFPGQGDDKLMLTASHTREAGPRLVPVFDAAMKTFRLR